MSGFRLSDGGRRLKPYGTGKKLVGGLLPGEQPDDAVTLAQLEAVQEGTVDLARIEFSASGSATAPVLTRDGDDNTGLYFIGANNIGITANGAKVLDINTSGLDVTGAITASTSITATTTVTATTGISLGTDLTGVKEVDHVLTVATTTTAATAGGKITLKAGTGATSGTGGAVEITGGTAGATAGATSGAVTISSGAEGAGAGITGAVNIITAAATGGAAGNINITPGATSSTTISACNIISNGVVRKPLSGTVASGGTITGKQLVDGLIAATGATGNWQLPTAAQITTAIGATPAGTWFDFVFNAAAMTATNTATLVVGTNMTVMSAPAITGGGTLTVTQDTQVVGHFRITYDTATTCKISRIA